MSVMQSKEAVVLGSEASGDARFAAERDLPTKRPEDAEAVRLSGLVCFPLFRSDGEVLGAVSVLNKQGAGYGAAVNEFTQQDVLGLRGLGESLARGIENNGEFGSGAAAASHDMVMAEMLTDMLKAIELKDFPDIVCNSLRQQIRCEQADYITWINTFFTIFFI